jgi:small subunit ribosomal protein S6
VVDSGRLEGPVLDLAVPPLLPKGAVESGGGGTLRRYEMMVILDPEADEQQVGAVVDRVTQILSQHGGEVSGVDRWGRRKLAFEIDRKGEGFYAVISFTAESEALGELDRVLSLADEVMRFKVVQAAA